MFIPFSFFYVTPIAAAGGIYSYSTTNLSFPISTTGYIVYAGGFTSNDDGYSNSPITLPVAFSINAQSSTSLYMSTNGYFTLTSGDPSILSGPTTPNPSTMAGNPNDNWLQPGLINSDGDTQNWWYQTGSNGTGKYYVKNIVYGGTYGATTTQTSWLANFYRDSTYEWFETRIKSNSRGNAGPYNASSVAQTAATTSRVWRGDLNGQNWTYLGTGSVIP